MWCGVVWRLRDSLAALLVCRAAAGGVLRSGAAKAVFFLACLLIGIAATAQPPLNVQMRICNKPCPVPAWVDMPNFGRNASLRSLGGGVPRHCVQSLPCVWTADHCTLHTWVFEPPNASLLYQLVVACARSRFCSGHRSPWSG